MTKKGLIKGIFAVLASIALILAVSKASACDGNSCSTQISSQTSSSQSQNQTQTSTSNSTSSADSSSTSSASASATAEVKVKVKDHEDHHGDHKKSEFFRKRLPATGDGLAVLAVMAVLAAIISWIGVKKFSAKVK